MTIQSDILFIPEDFSTSQLNKRTEYLVEYLKECSLIARELSIEFDREFPGAQISLKRSGQPTAVAVAGRFADGALIQLQFWRRTTPNTRRKSFRSKPARAQINYALSTAAAELQRLREYRRIENDLLAAA